MLLEVRNLTKHFQLAGGWRDAAAVVRAVDGVDLDLAAGETVGLVGESGCGKSTLGRLILRLLEPTAGAIRFDGRDLLALSGSRLRELRREIQVVFQDPYGSLNPRMRVADIVGEGLEIHRIARGAAKRARVGELLERVGLRADAAQRFPHEFSGGQRQRIGIARALALRPRLIIADEPVSALDVSVQAQILNLMQDLQAEYGLAYLFISHDLRVVRHISQRVAIMYLGRIVELGASEAVFACPRHPYTQSLLSAIPSVHAIGRRTRAALVGEPPSPVQPPPGCHFHPRCGIAEARCRTDVPLLRGDGHLAACHLR